MKGKSLYFYLENTYDIYGTTLLLEIYIKQAQGGECSCFIQIFLSDRVFYLGSVYSNLHEQEMGAPQGSIFSVTLFNLKIDTIDDVFPFSFEKSLL